MSKKSVIEWDRYIVKCKKCLKDYKQSIEYQAPSLKTKAYDVCPYCGNINHSSVKVDFFNSPLEDDEIIVKYDI